MTAKTSKPNKTAPGAAWPVILAYLVSFLLVVFAALLMLYSTLGSKNYMQGQVRSSGFSATAYKAMSEDFTSYAASTGFSTETLTGVLSQQQIETDMNDAIAKMYAGDTTYNGRAEIGQAAYDAMELEAGNRGLTLEGDTATAVQTVAEAMRQEYAGYTALPLASQIHTLIQKLNKVTWIGLAVCAVFLVLAVVLLFRLSGGDLRLGVRCLVYALGGAVVVCFVLGLAITPLMGLQRFSLNPPAYKDFVISYISGMFGRFNLFGTIYLVLGALLGALFMPRKGRPAKRYVMDANNYPIEEEEPRR